MPAALAELVRPRQMARIRRTVARSRAEGALFDAVLWSVCAVVGLTLLLFAVNFVEWPWLGAWDIDRAWLVAGGVLVALFGAAALWWRWFKWHVLAAELARRAPGVRSQH